ncbi:MAG: hypothetical protein FWD58_10715 [Firmicutes bacterium]|nr:hypothetical protein [Bacillota bacterium]
MERKTYQVHLEKNTNISMDVIPGHFSTGHFHTNYFLDVSELKSNAKLAREVARELALPYFSTTAVDTIVCIENTKVIGAYLAEELLAEGTAVMNEGGEIHVVTFKNAPDGKLIFYDNEVKLITNKNILFLTTTVSSGQSVKGALECLSYYGGRVAGISSLFLFSGAELDGREVKTLFTSDDIPGYRVYDADECGLCKAGHPLEALISSEGYKKI